MGHILLLGASGFIGSHLAANLLPDHQVIGYSRHTPAALMRQKNYRHISGNFATEEDFHALLERFDVSCIYHCISTTVPCAGTAHTAMELQDNILPTVRLLEAAADCEVERVIFVSSGGTVYGEGVLTAPHRESELLEPICSYGVQKLCIESYLRLYRHMRGLKTITARISNPYGLCLQRGRTQGIIPILLRRLLQREGIVLYGETIRDYIHIDDAVAALAALSDYSGEQAVLNIGSGQGVGLHQLVREIELAAGETFTSIRQEPIRSCDVECSILDISLIQKELGWQPRISLQSGIRRTVTEMAEARQ